MFQFHSPLLKVKPRKHLLLHLPHILLLLVHFFFMMMADDDPRFLSLLVVDPEQLRLLSLSSLLGLLLQETNVRSVVILQTGTNGVHLGLSLFSQFIYF